MKTLRTFTLALTLAAAAALAGCAEDAAPDALDGDQDPSISRTIVHLHADGTQTVVEDMITPAEQQAELAAPESGGTARIQPVNCVYPALRIYDRPNFTGNELCLYGPGEANLRAYKRRVCTRSGLCYQIDWHDGVRSFQAGSSGGHFALEDVPLISWRFSPAEAQAALDSYAQQSDLVTLYDL